MAGGKLLSQNPLSAVGTAAAPDVILLKRAVLAFRSGDKQVARDLLVEAAEHNPENELVWLWRASAARTRGEACEAIDRVLDLNPENEKALLWLEKLRPARTAPQRQPQNGSANGHSVDAAAEVAEAPAEEAEAETETAVESEQTVEAAEESLDEEAAEQAAAETAEETALSETVEGEAEVVEEAAQAVEEVEEEAVEAEAVDAKESADDAESRLAELESYLESGVRESAGDAEPGEAVETREVEGYGFSEETSAEETEASGDIWDRLTRSDEAAEEAEADGNSGDDPLAALLESDEQATLDAGSEDAAETDAPTDKGREQEYNNRLAELEEKKAAESDIWASLGMAGMDSSPAAAPVKSTSAAAGFAEAGVSARESAKEEAKAAVAAPVDEDDAETEEGDPPCFICEKLAPPQDGVCSSCRGVVDLRLIDLTARHEGADRAQLTRALERVREQIEDNPTAATYIRAALVSLNLRQSQQALLYLREACRLRPHDRDLVGYHDQLEKRPLILAVDDSKTVQKMISTVLEKESYRVIQAEDGLGALAKLDEELPNLILLDITMPRMDGYQVCKVINGNDATKHIPVIMLSGKDGFFDKVRGKMVGASNYITKPFDPAELAKSIAKFLKN